MADLKRMKKFKSFSLKPRGDETIIAVVDDDKNQEKSGKRPYLFVAPENEPGRWRPLNKKVTTLGRGSENVIQIDNSNISREHCRIITEGPRHFIVEDLNSTNGTFINGSRIKIHRLQKGDTIYLGQHVTVLFEIK